MQYMAVHLEYTNRAQMTHTEMMHYDLLFDGWMLWKYYGKYFGS